MAKTILMVDDDRDTLSTFGEILGEYGYKIIAALSGEEALEKVSIEKPDIVLLDTLLPGINGYEVCREIRKTNGLTPKIIVYTGVVDAVDAGRARSAGADDYIVKTTDLSLLIDAIKKLE